MKTQQNSMMSKSKPQQQDRVGKRAGGNTVLNEQFVQVQDVKLPSLGFGTWQLEGKAAETAVADALSLGYRHIDTAQAYGNEAEVGKAIVGSGVPREEIFLTTKVWNTNMRHDAVIASVEESLKKLRTLYVDLLLIHWPSATVPMEETLGAMAELQRLGKVRHIGVSNFTLEQLRNAQRLTGGKIFTNQVEYHPYLSQEKLVAYAAEQNMLVTAYSPLARGRVSNDKTLNKIGARHGKTAGQVALRWLIQQKNVVAIPKATTHEHIAENLDIYDFQLSDEEMSMIRGIAEKTRLVNPAWAPAWD